MKKKEEINVEKFLLEKMEFEAVRFISTFRWSPPVQKKILCFAVGGVIALYFFKFSKKVEDSDEDLWVIVGDLPYAYMVVDENYNPRDAMETYCDLMEDWCLAVQNGKSLSEVYPVDVSPSQENVDLLRKRINFIREDIISCVPLSVPQN